MSFYRTKLVLEVEVSTQFGPEDAKIMIEDILNKPAISNLIFLCGRTNYIKPLVSPSEQFIDYDPSIPQNEQFPL